MFSVKHDEGTLNTGGAKLNLYFQELAKNAREP